MRTLKQTFNLQRLKSQIGMFYLLGFIKFANSKLLIHLPNFSLVYGAKTKNQSLQLLQSNPLVSPHDGSFLCFHLPVKESPHSLSDHCSFIPSRIHVLLYHEVLVNLPYQSLEAFCRLQTYRCSRKENLLHHMCGHMVHFPYP